MVRGSRTCLCTLLALGVVSHAAKVTPMEKVISLLKDLSAKVAAEGAKEAAQYDKFACFCKEQADEKLYNIEKSDAKIADLKAQIEELQTSIADLNSQISDLSKQISKLEADIDRRTKIRAKERKLYEAKAKDMNEAIDACAAAIEALKDSKNDMSDAKLDLLQAVKKQPELLQAASKVSLLSKLDSKAAPKFEYQSNDIIATLEDLLATFNSMKKDLDFKEHDDNSLFERTKLGLSNEKKFAEKDRAEKQSIVEAKTEDLEAAKQARDEETADRNSDDAFMKELTNECEAKANQFDQRSSTRADELKALSEATSELQSGAVPNFGANKKLNGLMQTKKVVKAPASFVQIRSHRNVQHQHTSKAVLLQRIQGLLNGAAGRTGSTMLSTMAARIGLQEDHFAKVRQLIKDLIAKLKADAKAEAEQKGICDTGMRNAVNDRDKANGKIEAANAKITTATAKKNALEDEIDTLNGQIAELKKALLEATELRAEDKADNTKTMTESAAGAESVKLALSILKGFYENAFVQTGKYVPPKSDRDGNTVGDLAPEVFDSSYNGAQSESKGILGILEVILSDFNRQNKQSEKEEKMSKQEFEKFEKDTNSDVSKKEKRIKKADGEVADAEADILDNQGALSDAKELLESALGALEDLEAMCVKGEETWEERKKRREDEINALKEALQILEDWQGF